MQKYAKNRSQNRTLDYLRLAAQAVLQLLHAYNAVALPALITPIAAAAVAATKHRSKGIVFVQPRA
jgi:hypothetical protein